MANQQRDERRQAERQANKQPKAKSRLLGLLLKGVGAVAVLAVMVVAMASLSKNKADPTQSTLPQSTQQVQVPRADAVTDSDLVIPLADITETASFYPVVVDGTQLEVLAVKASDGTIRTAFNTCQVCYSSGRGYYQQEGDVLICQNCGNQFHMDEVEVTRGGCNPVPVGDENKTVTDTSITIPLKYLQEAEVIFANWKTV
ncbi:MAG: DUF2318 domain-containing protein [Oscillospiraceae bacterium]